MATEIVRLTPEWMPALRRFAAKVWTRPRSDAFHRWRYEASRDFHPVWLAVRDGEVLATEAAIRRPWRVADETVDVLEVFEWYALPELRKAGVGVRVMQALMKEPHPLLLVGGSPDTQGLLPRLNWQVVAQAERYVLPLDPARLAGERAGRLRLPAPLLRLAARAALARPGYRPRRRRVPRDGRALAVATPGTEILALYQQSADYQTVPLWPESLLRWLLVSFPAVGHFIPVCFVHGDTPVGWALLRVRPTDEGCDAELLECFAPRPTAELYTWMVSEMAVLAAAFGPGMLGAQATCPLLATAMRRNHFVRRRSNPVQLWWPGREGLPGPMAIGSNTNDSAISFVMERWWGEELSAGEQP